MEEGEVEGGDDVVFVSSFYHGTASYHTLDCRIREMRCIL